EEPAADAYPVAPALSSSIEAAKNLGERSVAEVPLPKGRLRVYADQADSVRRRADDRAHRRSVDFLARYDRLSVQRRRVRPRRELRMCQIETGVDDRDRHPGSGRLDLVVADVMDPPLVRNQWVGRAEVREGDQPAVGLDVRKQTLST